jgi:hypothetical protein
MDGCLSKLCQTFKIHELFFDHCCVMCVEHMKDMNFYLLCVMEVGIYLKDEHFGWLWCDWWWVFKK